MEEEKVVAKVVMDKVEQTQGVHTGIDGAVKPIIFHTVHLHPVYGNSEENKKFYMYTPSGSFVLSVVSPETAAFFELGKEYFVEFKKA